jgi:hypothetical protein
MKKNRELQRRLDHHFLACSASAGAIALAVTPAGAGIVYSGPQNVAVPFTGPGLSIDLDTGTFSTTEEVSGFDLFFTETGAPGNAGLRFAGGAAGDGVWSKLTTIKHTASSASSSSSSTTTASVKKFNAGKLITSVKTFANMGLLGEVSSGGARDGFWGYGGSGYVGFEFVSAANTTLYGWVQLAVGEDLTATVVDWAYDDSGQPIVAGITQETTVRMKVVQPTDGAAAEFKFIREGDVTVPLKVYYTVDSKSTAISGTDYQPLPGTIVIPAGAKSALLPINALGNSAAGSPRKLRLNLTPGKGYDLGKARATVSLSGGQ